LTTKLLIEIWFQVVALWTTVVSTQLTVETVIELR